MTLLLRYCFHLNCTKSVWTPGVVLKIGRSPARCKHLPAWCWRMYHILPGLSCWSPARRVSVCVRFSLHVLPVHWALLRFFASPIGLYLLLPRINAKIFATPLSPSFRPLCSRLSFLSSSAVTAFVRVWASVSYIRPYCPLSAPVHIMARNYIVL